MPRLAAASAGTTTGFADVAFVRSVAIVRRSSSSTHGPRAVRLDTFPIITNQVGYHLFDFRPEEEVFPFCTDNGMGAMAYGSLAHGLLTGMMTPETQFEEDDWRRSLMAFGQPLFKGETFLRNLGKVEALKNIASEKGMTVAQLALAWVISNPAVSVALVGTRRAAEMEENVKAAEWMMGEEERDAIRAVITGE